MRAPDLIRKKRDGGVHTREELTFLVEEYTAGKIPDYQLSAWLMAVYFRGMTAEETAALTDVMLHSGEVLDFSDLPGRKVDKHSTGGVGDKTSLVIAPVVAAAGVRVPMISGRGLGHTGGTLDKLESIPGFNVHLAASDFRRALEETGCGLIGQTARIAPADRKLYALRDVTATVENIALITASILSKKLAEGIDALVLDVKFGSGAFMKELPEARRLAESLQSIGTRMGKKVVALLTDMSQPLGRAVGNALEVREALETLRGEGPEDLDEVCRELSAWMLLLGEAADDLDAGRELYRKAIAEGTALGKLRQIIAFQGGDAGVVEDAARLPQARERIEYKASGAGWLRVIDAERVGRAAMALGAGRANVEDAVDPAVGLVLHKKVGDQAVAGETLATLHVNRRETVGEAEQWLAGAFEFGSGAVTPPVLVRETLT